MRKLVVSAILTTLSSAAMAIPVTFFGEDTSTAGIDLGPNSQAARNDFLSNLSSGIGIEDFESLSGSAPLNLTFPGSSGNLTATLNGSASINQSGPGRFATSGVNFVQASTGSMSIDFGTGVSAFGFNGIDIGDFVNAQMSLELAGNGGTIDLTVPHSLNIGNNDNATLFWGFYDLTETYTGITFNNAGGGDTFAFDDLVVGDLGQITVPPTMPPTSVPEPSILALLGLGVTGLLVTRRKTRT